MNKPILIVAVCVAVLAAAISAVVVTNNRRAIARARADVAASEEAKSENDLHKAEAEEKAASERRRAAEQTKKAEADKLATAKLDAQKAEEEARAAEANAQAKAAERDAARARDAEAGKVRDTERAKADQARSEKQKAAELAKAEEAKARAAEAKLAQEKMKSEKIISEAKLIELRKIDFATWQQQLVEKEQEVAERERAITPEKTVANLSWAGGMEDSTVDEHGNVTNVVKKAYSPETDFTLPRGTRALARAEREARELQSEQTGEVRTSIVTSLEELYVRAIKDDCRVDAEYYRKALLSLCPGWKLSKEAGEKLMEEKK